MCFGFGEEDERERRFKQTVDQYFGVRRLFGGARPLFRGATLRGQEAETLSTLLRVETRRKIPLAVIKEPCCLTHCMSL